MPHPPYSPDLAPCDYWLNDYTKNRLTDQLDEKSLARALSKIVKNISEEEFKKILTNCWKEWNFVLIIMVTTLSI